MAKPVRAVLGDVKQLMTILDSDRTNRLLGIDEYVHGNQADPYIPATATAEYKLLVRRAITNQMPLVIGLAASSLAVDSVRPGRMTESADTEDDEGDLPEWKHWQYSRLDARQYAMYFDALAYGQAFAVTELDKKGKVFTKAYSPLVSAALFEDPANDDEPVGFLAVTRWPVGGKGGLAYFWNETNKFQVTGFGALGEQDKLDIVDLGEHRSKSCPATRFAPDVDLLGRTTGVVAGLISRQDRINQAVFDLLIVASGGAFTTKWAAGMAPPYKMRYVQQQDGSMALQPLINELTGEPVLDDVALNAMSILFNENENGKFGSIPGTPLDGYISAVESAIKEFAARSQTPPHYLLLGSVVNLSADALQAAETSLERKLQGYRFSFGESWERVFRLAAALEGVDSAAEDYAVETIWRILDARSITAIGDAISKLQAAGFPVEGLMDLIPGMTRNQKTRWLRYIEEERERAKEEDAASQLAASVARNQAARSANRPEPTHQGGTLAQQDGVSK